MILKIDNGCYCHECMKERLMRKTVWVVWDPLYERVISVHETEKGADNRCEKENKKDNRWDERGRAYLFECDEFELEE